jgi:hypothetical protein
MSLILVRVKRPEAAHHHSDGKIYRTGEPFMMEEEQFQATVPGFFERADAPPEQIKSKELPPGEPATGPATAAVQEPPGPANASTDAPELGEKKGLNLQKKKR